MNIDFSKCGTDGNSPLYASCKNGHVDIVEMLLDNNEDTTHCDDQYFTLHVKAVKSKSFNH